MVKYNGRNIVYTFKYGVCLTGSDKLSDALWSAFFFVLGISLFIPCYLEKHKFIAYEILIVFCFAGCVFLAITIFNRLRNRCAEKEISEWLADERLFEACIETYQLNKIRSRNICSYRLSIDFEKNGEKYSKFTSHTEKVRYFHRLKKIVKSDIVNIVYSPKYGEVMVLEVQGNS